MGSVCTYTAAEQALVALCCHRRTRIPVLRRHGHVLWPIRTEDLAVTGRTARKKTSIKNHPESQARRTAKGCMADGARRPARRGARPSENGKQNIILPTREEMDGGSLVDTDSDTDRALEALVGPWKATGAWRRMRDLLMQYTAAWRIDVVTAAKPYFVPPQSNWAGVTNGLVAIVVPAYGASPPLVPKRNRPGFVAVGQVTLIYRGSTCYQKYRAFTSGRRRKPLFEPEEEYLYRELQSAKMQVTIANAKNSANEELLATLDRDPWGRPYRIVRGKMRISPSTDFMEPELLNRVVTGLFPRPPVFRPPIMAFPSEEHDGTVQAPQSPVSRSAPEERVVLYKGRDGGRKERRMACGVPQGKWDPQRRTLVAAIGGDLSLPCESSWVAVADFCEDVISQKEAAEWVLEEAPDAHPLRGRQVGRRRRQFAARQLPLGGSGLASFPSLQKPLNGLRGGSSCPDPLFVSVGALTIGWGG
ncbi:jg162 [Pararge aegeria aegeria]|uniref:Jg162 protein n=1 Tax=Pararge aegeria aegeria TaxID=348720 RepID=A0A8S4QZW6_9NEOP|nr:jg162 [Pararge aegeria aegeria]